MSFLEAIPILIKSTGTDKMAKDHAKDPRHMMEPRYKVTEGLLWEIATKGWRDWREEDVWAWNRLSPHRQRWGEWGEKSIPLPRPFSAHFLVRLFPFLPKNTKKQSPFPTGK